LKARRSEAARKSESSRGLARAEILGILAGLLAKHHPAFNAVLADVLTNRGLSFNVTRFFEQLA
jgi:hypothetical protein